MKLPKRMRHMHVHGMLKRTGMKNMNVVELGVYQGSNAKMLLDYLSIDRLYLVDSYNKNPHYEKNTGYDVAHKKLKPYTNKIVWVQKDSIVASRFVHDELDYIYYDIGRLTYNDLKNNLDVWIPKLKIGGFMSGRGFRMSNYEEAKCVVDYDREHSNLELDGIAYEWWFKKE